MANFSRWFNYAKARFDATIRQGHQELDELEAQREAEVADKPWLSATGDAPTFDEAKARIQWEAEHASRAARGPADAGPSPHSEVEGATPARSGSTSEAGAGSGGGVARAGAPGATRSDGPATTPEDRAAAAEAASARLELEARRRESAARLDAIRAELGIEPPGSG